MDGNGTFYTSRSGCLVRILLLALAVTIGARLLPGVHVDSIWAILLTAVVISLLDNLVRPVLVVVTLPATALTLGLFLFVINALIILMSSAIVRGFHVDSFWSALLFSLVLTAVNYLLELPNRYIDRKELRPRDDHHNDDDEEFTPYEEIKD